jgi:hypothetical protein
MKVMEQSVHWREREQREVHDMGNENTAWMLALATTLVDDMACHRRSIRETKGYDYLCTT